MLTVRRAVLCLLWNYASEWMIWQLLELLSHGPPEERHSLHTGTNAIRREVIITRAGGDSIFNRPVNRFLIVAAFRYIDEYAGCH